jgi:para-nitrobenzyl esterase
MLQTPVETIVTTRSGALRGSLDEGIHVFRGIPYAAPPFGPNHLRPPRPVEPWTGVRDALVDGAVAPQPVVAGSDAQGFIPPGALPGEDCLNLTIWTPELGAARLPVLVWITGGEFEFGSAGWYDGSRFARDGVVCVAINYRVGAEGFLHADGMTANRGLLDQVAALEWVRDTIAGFGGDPDNVTVCGESAGAMSIGCLLVMPRARGLFRRAILESGAAHHVLRAAEARRTGTRVAAALGVAPTLDALAAVPTDRLLAAQLEIHAELAARPDQADWGSETVATSMPFHPVVDRETLPAAPIERIGAGASADVDVLVGTNIDDWKLFLAASGMLPTITDAVLTGPVVEHGYRAAAAYGVTPAMLAAYRAAHPTASPGELLALIQTDWWCRIPAIRLADAHASGAGRTFMYEFGWPSPVADGLFGACHGLEIPFVFDTLDQGAGQMLGNLLGENPPQALANRMHAAWVGFIGHGDAGWPTYDRERRATKRFDVPSSVATDSRSWERQVWEGIR